MRSDRTVKGDCPTAKEVAEAIAKAEEVRRKHTALILEVEPIDEDTLYMSGVGVIYVKR
jgi:hypothetical protein